MNTGGGEHSDLAQREVAESYHLLKVILTEVS